MSTLESKAPDAPIDKIEWRVDGKPSSSNKSRFVPYLDAPTVAELLDDWVGAGNWKDDYENGPGKGLYCRGSIRVGDEWVTKTDIGVPSNFEPEKGSVSDAFKRVFCLKWGVGRNVYDLPTLWAPCDVRQNGKGENVAYPNDKTLPDLHRQLKALGIDANGGRVAAAPEHEIDGGGAPTREEERPAPAATDAGPVSYTPAVDTCDPDAMDKPDLVAALTLLTLPTNGPVPILRARLREHLAEHGAELDQQRKAAGE